VEGALREDPANTLGEIPVGAAGVVDLGAVVDLGTAAPAVVVLTFEADLEAPAIFAAGMGLLLVSVFRFRLTVFFLVVVVEPVFLESVLPFFVALDLVPAPPATAFLLVALPLDAVELPVAAAGLGGGAMPNNRSSSRTLS
jgi:hypothetical protein